MSRNPLCKAAMLMVTLAVMACGQESTQAAEKAAPAVRKDEIAQYKALILARTVAGGTESAEYQAAKKLGFPVTLATDEQWAGMTAAQFAEYRLIILGDANCASLEVVSAALANRHVWGPAVNGNMLVAGTAPVANGATSVTEQAIRFASDLPGMTGLYVSLSCYYQNAPPNTHVALLEAFGDFSVQGGGCYNRAHVVGEHPALAQMTDSAMSNWPCSVNAQFDGFPRANFAPLSVAEYTPGSRGSVPTVEFTDGTLGAPYILARGVNLLGCGNGEQEVGEECDYGYESNGLGGSECSATCQLNWCGDGVVNAGENCDEGSMNGLGACPRACRTIPAPPPPPPPSNRPPVARCRPVSLSAGPACGGVGASINDGSSDPDGNLVGCVQSLTAFEVGSTQATLTCTDAGGLVSSCTAQVNVMDDSAPTISCPEASSFECGVGQAAVASAQAHDNCVAPFVTSRMEGEGYVLNTPRAVSWLASDGANEATCSTSITMVDTRAPHLVLRGAAVQQMECGVGSFSEAGYTASDLCAGDLTGNVSVSSTVDSKVVGSYAVNYRVEDGAGLAATASRTVKVEDTLAPSIALVGAQSMKLECGVDSFTNLGATAVDACSGNLTAAITYSGAVNTAAVGTYSVNASVVDGAGLAATAVRSVEVADTLVPSIALVGAQSMQVECGGSFTNPGATATDACSGDLTAAITYSGAVNTAAVGSYNVTARVADGAGLASTAVRSVAVADTQAPSIALVGASSMKLECGVDSFVNPGATAVDACSGNLTAAITYSGAVNTAAVGTYSVNASVVDAVGLSAAAVRSVEVADTKAPVLSLVGAQSMQVECGGSFTNPGATATDACSGDLTAAITYSGAVNTAAVGGYNVTARVADAAGLAATAVRSVAVADTKAPAIALNGASLVNVECGVGSYTESGATATDVCTGDVSGRLSITGTVNTAARGTYTKTYSVADVSGNAASATRTVKVNDTLAPSIALVGASSMKLECGVDSFVNPGATAVDACSGNLTAAITYSGAVNTAAVGTYSVNASVVDAVGLSAAAVRSVQVADTKAPVITLTGASAMTLECGGSYTEAGASASDVCTGNVSSRLNITGTVNPAVVGTYTKNYSVTDVSGNVATAARTVTVRDTVAPVVTLAGAATMTVAKGSTFVDPGASATDVCSGTVTVTKTGSVNTAVPGTYTLTYTARDAAGLSSSKTRTVTVQGTTCNTTVTVKATQQIWPPNHSYQTFTLSDCAAVTTNCAPEGGGCHGSGADIDDMGEILSIYSDEVEDAQGNGDGRTDDDIVITGPSSFKLRAERQGKGNGRIYGVRFKVTDTSGASKTATCKFVVPHDQSDRVGVDDGAAAGYTVTAPNWP